MSIKIEEGKFYRTRDGRKVGPMYVKHPYNGLAFWGCDTKGYMGVKYYEDGSRTRVDDPLIAEWTDAPTGPVRTVTRKEVVPGRYGDVVVYDMGASVCWMKSADKIRAAAATLLEIADALEEGQ